MIARLKAWARDRAQSGLVTAGAATVLLQFFVGSVLDLLIGLFQIALVAAAFRIGSALKR
jgi:hypothetical protein